MKRSKDVDGNAMESQRQHDHFIYSVGLSWMSMVSALKRLENRGFYVHRITMRGIEGDGGEILLILAADTDEGAFVAFHQVDSLETVWKSLTNRIENGSLKWKPDEFAR